MPHQRKERMKYTIATITFFILFGAALTIFNELQRKETEKATLLVCKTVSDINEKLDNQNSVMRDFLIYAAQARAESAEQDVTPEQAKINREASRRYNALIEAITPFAPVKCQP